MYPKDPPHIPPRAARLFPKTGRVPGVFEGQLGGGVFEPFVRVEARDGLFGGCDEVFFVVWWEGRRRRDV